MSAPRHFWGQLCLGPTQTKRPSPKLPCPSARRLDAESRLPGICAGQSPPAHWGAGHGHTLHTDALDVARASGAAAATLWVLTTNQRARHFYERHGWLADSTEKTVWRGDVRLDETRYRISLGRER